MAQFTIELPEKSAGILAKAATDAGLSSEEFLAKLAKDALGRLEVPSATGYLALQVLEQCNADPSRKIGLQEILAAWGKSSGNADPGDLIDGLKDLAGKQFVRVVDTDVTILERGYKLIGGVPDGGQH